MIVSGVAPARAKMMYAAVYFAGPRWSETAVHNANLDKVFSILDTPFSRDVRKVVDADGITAQVYLDSGNRTSITSSDMHLHIDAFEQLIDRYDPSIRQIGDAIDNSVGLFGTMYPQQRTLLGVGKLTSLIDGQ
jgi:YD repeat-containing protein